MNQDRGSIRFFDVAGRKYAADVATGHAVPVSDAEWRALRKCCDACSEAPRRAGDRTGRWLKALRNRDVLRIPEPAIRASGPGSQRPQLFVPSGFLTRRERGDPLVNRNHYNLLTALAQRADIYMP